MNCARCMEYLDDYVDEALGTEQLCKVERHLAECEACRGELDELRSLVIAATELPREIAPGRNLWPRIASRIESRPVGRWVRRATTPQTTQWLQLAAVLGLMVVGLWIARSRTDNGAPSQPTDAPISAESIRPSYADHADRARSEDGIMLAKVDLLRTVERRRGVLDQPTLEKIEANMLLLEEAIGEIRAALAEQPENRRLKLALAARYQQEIRFLQQVSRV